LIEAVMLVALGFLCASLLALAALPALSRRAGGSSIPAVARRDRCRS
jgi:hypothetical protein